MGLVIPIQPGISWLYAMIVMILKLLISWIFVISRRWETSPVSPAKKADEADPHLANMGLPRNAVTTSCRFETNTLKIPNRWNGEMSNLQNPCTGVVNGPQRFPPSCISTRLLLPQKSSGSKILVFPVQTVSSFF